MSGVAVYLVIGLVLFVPVGLLAGFLQHKHQEEKDKEMNEPPFSDRA